LYSRPLFSISSNIVSPSGPGVDRSAISEEMSSNKPSSQPVIASLGSTSTKSHVTLPLST
jgi:hypothetical protein